MAKKFLRFPDNFLWGASSAAHQVEGNSKNNWSIWEEKMASELANRAEDRIKNSARYLATLPPDFDKILQEASNPKNYLSGLSANHYVKYKEDFDIAQQLNHNVTRISIAWERIQPQQDVIDKKAIEHYRKVLQAIRQRGMEPMVTLWHYTSPTWFTDSGDWESRKSIDKFVQFVELVVNEYKDLVTYWITINEPMGEAVLSYLTGDRPPNKKSVFSYLRVNRHLITAHRRAYKVIKELSPLAKVGMANAFIYFESYQNKPKNNFFKSLFDRILNYFYIDSTINTQDFIGINYYFHNRIDNGFNKNEYKVLSDMGWELYPEGIYHILLDLKRYKKPIIITEHGLADRRDVHRSWYIKESLRWIHKAMSEGVKVIGYLHWALTDNFEWDSGFWPRFGLIEIDYPTQKRTIRKSALAYAEIIKQNGLDAED